MPSCLIFVFDGSIDDIPSSEEEIKFYKDIIQMARDRKYLYPQVVLTCQDKIIGDDDDQPDRELHGSQSMHQRINDFEHQQKIRDLIDMKVEQVVLNLGISRSSVHFIENYKYESEP